jgi:hypothetical protein
MKKLAIGCGIVLVIAVVAGGIGAYYLLHKAQTMFAGFSELKVVPDLERQVRNTAAFTPPASGALSADQVARYVAVREQVRQKMGERFKELDARYKSLSERINRDQHSALDIPELIEAYKDLAGLYVLGKRAQVEALNSRNLSLSEYRWIQQQAYAAIGVPFMDMDISRAIDDVQAGRSPGKTGHVAPEIPGASDENKALVEPHRKLLEDNASLSFLGL